MKITSSKELGEMIRNQRKSLGYTQKYLADYTGFSASFISNLENGKDTAELGKALFLINLLGMDIEVKGRGAGHEKTERMD
jgi:HTH-type transcriptional regulator / antitoxin HipB